MILRRISTHCYTFALRAFPRRHRDAYAAEMIDAFQRELDARRRVGHATAIRFAIAASLNAIAAGIGERQRHREAARMSRSFLSALDVVLAWRMLVRYPGLTVISVFGMAVGIAVAGGAFIVVSTMMSAKLPLPESSRMVSLINWDRSTNNSERRMVHEFETWRQMSSLEDVAVSRTVERTLLTHDAVPETVVLAEMSAAAFRVARVPALRGRVLRDEDESAGAPDVIVIGHEEWLRRFQADPGVIGRSLQFGSTTFTIVGVMPEGFGFPVSHSFWIPWHLESAGYEPRTGPVVDVFARLSPGASLDSAQVELDAMSHRLAAASPATHEHLRGQVMPYTYAFNDMHDPENAIALRAIEGAIVLLLIVVCVNVAILVYARTATRQGEIAVRGALGASRRRIVVQLFVEAVLLAGVSAAIGVALLAFSLRQINLSIQAAFERLPFWMTLELSADGLIYIVVLTMLAAAIVGIVPALKATGRQVNGRLQGLSPGSGSRMQMGRLWTTLIVAQVALTVALLPSTMFQAWAALRFRTADPGFASEQFLTARSVLDRTSIASSDAGEQQFRSQYATVHAELERRLRAESAVREVTSSMTSPGGELALVVEVEGQSPPANPVSYNIVEGTKRGSLVRFNRVAPNFFAAFDVPVLMGRDFGAADAAQGAQGVLVNRTAMDSLFGGASPLGRRIRYVGRSREAAQRNVLLDRWYEIIGVVPDFPTVRTLDVERVSRIYHAAAPGDVYPVMLAIRINGPASNFANTLRALAADVDANLQLQDLASVDEAMKREQGIMRQVGIVIILVMCSVVVLSAAGIYALMSFTVARRRREIGIRSALGADPRRVLAGIFSRALAQLGLGAAVGLVAAFALEGILEGGLFQGQVAVILPIVIVFMTIVGVLAAIGPARRGLSIQPIEALREE